MAKELPYYQFEVAEYLAGDIMICSLEAQGLFSVIKCLYWQKECELNIKQVLKRYNNKEPLEELTQEGVIKVDKDGFISISFLDAQYQELKCRREKLSNAGRKGGLSKKKATLKPPLSHVKATPKHIEEKRKEEKRKEENRKEENIIPAYSDFLAHAISKISDIDNQAVKLKYDSWVENGWKDGNNNPIKNWKAKLTNTVGYLPKKKRSTNFNSPIL